MARKDALRTPVALVQSLAASFVTAPTYVKYLDNCSYQINVTTSDSVGTFTLQASNDIGYSGDSAAAPLAGTWVDLTLGGGTPSVSAANDVIMIDMNQLPFQAIRLKYTAGTPGTGTCDIWIAGKQIGG